MTEPIRPQDVISTIPDEVIEAFNELIQEHWNGIQSQFKQDEAVNLIATRMNRSESWVIKHNYLNVEDLYRSAGWIVEYGEAGYDESYLSIFTFSKKKVTDD